MKKTGWVAIIVYEGIYKTDWPLLDFVAAHFGD